MSRTSQLNAGPRHVLRLLHVERSPERTIVVRDLLARALGEGCHVECAREAPLLESREGWDLVLLGVGDEKRALEDLRRLRAYRDAVPVLALLEPEAAKLEARLRKEGVHECLLVRSEGISFGELLARVVRNTMDRQELVSGLEQARRLGMHLAHHDTLTDLPNRILFRSRLAQLIAQARRSMRSLAVLFLDLDRFKYINDTLGHDVGDVLLQAVGKRLEGCIRESDTIARRGGDEFTVILDGIRRGQDAAAVARKILDALSHPFAIEGHELFVGASIGISLFPADGADVETLIKHADIAMYRAKARGGNHFQFFLPEMNGRALERLELESSLRLALDRDEFVLHYQPQLDIASGRVCGVEALIRWEHPEMGRIYPDAFISLAEETGLIHAMGDWVLREAVRQNRAWQDEGLDPICMAVNFSARQFQFKQPVKRVAEVLNDAGLDPNYLDLELTESVVMKDASLAIEVLGQMRELGVEISIDDFGMGYSSLSYLKRFPITRLKIDRSFITNLLVDPKDAAITDAIIGIAHSLGIQAVAEGVEDFDQLERLRGPGCDQMQGYLFSKPLPADEITQLLREGRSLEPSRL